MGRLTGLDGFAIILAQHSTSSIPMAPIAPNAVHSAMSARVFIMSAQFAHFLVNSRPIFTIRRILVALASEFAPTDSMERPTAELVPIFASPAMLTAHFAQAIPHLAHSASQASIYSQVVA